MLEHACQHYPIARYLSTRANQRLSPPLPPQNRFKDELKRIQLLPTVSTVHQAPPLGIVAAQQLVAPTSMLALPAPLPAVATHLLLT